MMRTLLAGLLALALSACSSLATLTSGTTPNISPTAIYRLKASYDVARAGLVVYRSLPWCAAAPPPCQEPKIAVQIKRADKSAMAALGALEAVSKTGDTLSISVAYAAATQAIATATQIAATYHLGSK